MNNMYYQVVMTNGAFLSFDKKATKVIVDDRTPDVLWFLNDDSEVVGIVSITEISYVRLCNKGREDRYESKTETDKAKRETSEERAFDSLLL